jgi:glycosyltransferase involved in cell wall biosynthesis
MTKIIHLSYADAGGGAALAAYRIHLSLKKINLDSEFVSAKSRGDIKATRSLDKTLKQGLLLSKRFMAKQLVKTLRTSDSVLHSPSVFSSRIAKGPEVLGADIIHMHWVQGEMLAINEIGKINKPIVWTLHDMWAFCGAEHYTCDTRWKDGYLSRNRPIHESGFDLNRWTWLRKRRAWKRPINIVTPSKWLADCVRVSALMNEWPVQVIPNPIDLERWRPMDRNSARLLLNLPVNKPVIAFGAMGGSTDRRKGFDLLKTALSYFIRENKSSQLELVVFGESDPKDVMKLGLPTHHFGHIGDEPTLRAIYSASDAFVLPSRLDNLPNTGVEALACGTPLLAFKTGGLPDLVRHKYNGYLANALDPVDLALGLNWILQQTYSPLLRYRAREVAEENFGQESVANAYRELYEVCIARSGNN